jgi:predicted Zn finger-like uncharacterized protein
VKILCPTCGARYSIADERVVAGSTIRCRGCGGRIDLASNVVFPEATARDSGGEEALDGDSSQASEASALFSLAALTDLAQASAAVPEHATEGVAGDDSSLIDLRQLMDLPPTPDQKSESGVQQSDGASAGVVAPLGLVPLGVSPLGTPIPVETTPARPPVATNSTPTGRWIAFALVAVAAAVAATVVSLRSGPHGPQTPISSARVSPATAPRHAVAVRPSSRSQPVEAPHESESRSLRPATSVKPSAPPVRKPPSRARSPRDADRRPPAATKPPTGSASPARGPCSHCKPADLMCNMECAAKR